MHQHRTAGVPHPDSSAFRVQRAVLLELLVDPPEGGDPIGDLPRRLGATPRDVDDAIGALVRAGAAESRAGFVRASSPAWYVAGLGLVAA